MWNWNLRQHLFVRRAIGRTGQNSTSPYQQTLLGNASVQIPPVEISSTPLDLSRAKAVGFVGPNGFVPLMEMDVETYCAECDDMHETDVRE